jgi:hypothetical protein
MWYNLKRELKCPQKQCTDEFYCDGCTQMRRLLDSSFKKFLIFFVIYVAIFSIRFSLFTYTRMNDL